MSGSDGRTELASELLRQKVRLYLYGELSLSERRQVDRLRQRDLAFSDLFDEEEAFLLALDDGGVDEDIESMLGDCREDLSLAIAGEAAPPGRVSVWARAGNSLRGVCAGAFARPLAWQSALALVLVALGFFAGRSNWGNTLVPRGGPAAGEPLMAGDSPDAAGVETVQLDHALGQVRIVLEERRVMTGTFTDPMIRALLMDTARDSHAGARLASLEALRGHAGDGDVRSILLSAMLDDQNLGVRLRALDALRPHAGEQDVRRALVQMLRTDPLEGMRIHAIQALKEHPGRDLAGALQELVESEQNPFVIQESERILDVLDASMERF